MKILVFGHERAVKLGSLQQYFEDIGADVERIYTADENVSHISPNKHDLLVIEGGRMGADETEAHPYLAQEIHYLEKRLSRDLPILAICLGSQLMARALGEEVYAGGQGREFCWSPLSLTEAGHKTPVASFCGSKTMMMHNHADTYQLPKGAALLATTDKYHNQVWQYGRNAIAFQCHLESNDKSIAQSVARGTFDGIAAQGHNVAEFAQDAARYGKQLEQQMRLFMGQWLESVDLADMDTASATYEQQLNC